MTDISGQYLGRYYLTERLGEGGMATVYKAYDTRLERDVAVKIIRSAAFPVEAFDQVLKRFEREAKSLAKLSHPNIVKVYDYGEHDGSPYLVMEYLPGGTLKKILGKPVPWQDAVRLLLPIARGIAYAHQRGILHRDIKPANILITEGGEPMLSDFGIAKLFDADQATALTGSGMAIGTPEYMAPEQWTGTTSPQSDLYSLGIVLYEMVAGRKPYVADTPAAILIKQATEPLPSPRKFAVDVPEALELVLIKTLVKEPGDRYRDMNAFIGALESLLVGAPVVPPLPPEPRRVEETYRVPSQKSVAPVPTQISTQVGSEAVRAVDAADVQKVEDSLPSISSIPKARFPIKLSRKGTGLLIGGVVIFLAVWLGSPSIGKWFSPAATATILDTGTFITTVQPIALSPTPNPVDTVLFTPTHMQIQNINDPSGKIVFTCQIDKNENSDQICIIDTDGSNYRQLTYNSFENYYPSLAPDGNSIVFASNQTGEFEIYEMDLNGNQERLTSQIGELSAPDISPDGSLIVFTNNYSSIAHIWAMKRNGDNPHEVFGTSNQDSLDPVWSPDGKQILFAIGTGENRRLHIINKDGSGLKQIDVSIVTRGRNDWSPDGFTIGTYSGESWYREIYLFNLDGSNLRQISNGGNVLAPSFSPDGQWIAFTGYIDNYGNSDGCEIYIMRIDGSDVRRLTNNNYCDWQPRWGP